MRCRLPSNTLLGSYASQPGYTDCYCVTLPGSTSLAQFVESFYTSGLFKLERWLLARALGLPASDADAAALAQGAVQTFSAWRVEGRTADELLVAAGRTRSWFKVMPATDLPVSSTVLLFGSAVVPGRNGRMGLPFYLLSGFHRLYARSLLAAAARRLAHIKPVGGAASDVA
ncbi:DUF2867 domain-containing protein [Andreprevotia lacus]|nr:DUF2867 domain-containing protein [Andreprevotia lacus]